MLESHLLEHELVLRVGSSTNTVRVVFSSILAAQLGASARCELKSCTYPMDSLLFVNVISIVHIIVFEQTITETLWSTRDEESMINSTGDL